MSPYKFERIPSTWVFLIYRGKSVSSSEWSTNYEVRRRGAKPRRGSVETSADDGIIILDRLSDVFRFHDPRHLSPFFQNKIACCSEERPSEVSVCSSKIQ